MKIKLYDSYTRSLREFEPLNGNEVRMYACGPTVYNHAHIGNLRTYIFEDVLQRTLRTYGYDVIHVMNITDVGHLASDADTGEDKIEQGSKRTGKTAWEIAELYTQAFRQDLAALNILEPSVWCRATDHIKEQICDIRVIEEKGYTYITSDGVYFDTAKLEDYGYLARLNASGQNAGQRVDIGEKRCPTDFALWKFSPPGQRRQMEWDSPWGAGFPGWHIECSAMSAKYLGVEFDIHCGGKDHIPIHHTNEIAQSEVCFGTRLANFWMHGYFLEVDRQKMSKSSGEFLRLQTLLDNHYDPLSYRYLCLTAHYRSDLKFAWDSLDSAQITLNRLRSAVCSWGEAADADPGYLEQFNRQVFNDLNTPKALAVVWELVRSALPDGVKKATIRQYDQIMGLNLCQWAPVRVEVPQAVQALLDQRKTARESGDWKRSDRLRERISLLGYEIEDSRDGPRIRKKA